MTGYVRKDTTNNIADGNVINAADLDAEFDGVQDAFNASTGHKHDGTAGEGATINALGPTQDVTISSTLLAPKTTNTVDIGSSALKFKDLFLAGNSSIGGTLAVTGVATLGAGAILNTPASVTLTNATGLPIATGVSGLGTGVATALAVNVGSAGAPVVNGGALGTPSSGTVTNLTGTASININGTVGATTPTTGAFTTVAASSSVTLSGGTANGVTYLNGSKVLTSGSALTFDGTTLTATQATAAQISLNNSSGNYLFLTAAGGAAYIDNRATGSINFRSNGTFNWQTYGGSDQMSLTSTGLGIGTSAPAAQLQLNKSGTGDYTTFRLSNSGASGKTYEIGVGGNTSASGYANNLYFYDSTAGALRMVLDSAGNLGLGVTPSAWGTFKASQVNDGSLAATTGNNTVLASNAYYDGSWRYSTSSDYAGYYQQISGGHRWHTASATGTSGGLISFTQAMTLTATGRLGIGTTGPATTLDARGDACLGTNLYLGADTVFQEQRITVVGSTSGSTGLTFSQWTGAAYTERARITSSGYFKASNTGTYQSSTSTYHELRNDANANTVRISNTIASGYTDAVAQIAITGYSPNTTNSWFLFCDDSTTNRVQLRSNGGIANYSANDVNLSDRREKTNFAPAGSYLDKICAIPVQTFNYIDQNLEEDGGLTLGVVAQDVQAVAPELVMESNWAAKGDEPKMRLSIYQTDLQYALMKALQELKAEFDAYVASHP